MLQNVARWGKRATEAPEFIRGERHTSMTGHTPYSMLMSVAFARGDLELASQVATQYEWWALRHQHAVAVADARLQLGVFAYYLGKPERAAALIGQGRAFYEQGRLPLDAHYYDAVCLHYEKSGAAAEAIRLREEQISSIEPGSGLDQRFYTQLRYCRLLGRAGRDLSTALAAAETIANESVKPARHLEKVERIRAGDYYDYAWQKPS